MSRFTEKTYKYWQRPASEAEETRISNAIKMVKDAISSSEELKTKDIDIFVQGSYANNTNVRVESDVDVCVMLKDTFYTEYPDGLSDNDYGFTYGTNSFNDFRKNVQKALINKYGDDNIKLGNKSIKIIPNSYRAETDAIPSFQYRNYKYLNSKNSNNFKEGIKFYSLDKNVVVNYPKIHIENGVQKNHDTDRRYKRLVRVFKRIRYKMIDDKIAVSKEISSFLIECLIWNVPNTYFNNFDTLEERLRQTIIYLFHQTKTDEKCKEWGEVSEMLYLFHSSKKWDIKMTNNFLKQVWNYLEFK